MIYKSWKEDKIFKNGLMTGQIKNRISLARYPMICKIIIFCGSLFGVWASIINGFGCLIFTSQIIIKQLNCNF